MVFLEGPERRLQENSLHRYLPEFGFDFIVICHMLKIYVSYVGCFAEQKTIWFR